MQRLVNAEEVTYGAIDSGKDASRDKILANFMAPKELCLRVDAQVMLIKNVDEQLVNGTMGRVIKFTEPAKAAEGGSDIPNGVGVIGTIPKKTSASVYQRWPLVQFSLANGEKKTMAVGPETWKVELQTGEIQASRIQVHSSCQVPTNYSNPSLDSTHSSVGDEHSQISGPNFGPCQGRP
jgi:ATP-dependent DNA helicase PIF1